MMNSTTDEFGDNPFRSSGGGNEDLYFDANSQGNSPGINQQQQQQQQPTSSFQQQPMMEQPPESDPFAPQSQMTNHNFPPLSGPMQAQMSPQQPQELQPVQMQPPTTRWGNCMACLTLDSYKAYFDIDAEDIFTRIKAVPLHFYKPEYFRNNVLGAQKTDTLKGPDLYGPFWITMTLIFFIAVTSNMHDYLHKSDVDEFDYDINHLLRAASVLCSYAFALPLILWVTTQCMNMHVLLLVDWVCLYGYSLVPFLPAVVLCIIPFGIVSWIVLSLATGVSCSLVVRNVAAPLLSSDVGQAKAPPVLLAILGTHIIFFLFLKFSFYHQTSS